MPFRANFGIDSGRFFEAQIEAYNDLDENVKIVFSPWRESSSQCFEGIEKPLKIDGKASLQPCWQKLREIVPNFAQNGPKSDPRGSQNAVIILLQPKKQEKKRAS